MLYPNFNELLNLQAAVAGNILKNKYSRYLGDPGDYSSLFCGQGMEFDNVRPYIVGDDIRHFDWRVTARTQTPYIKTFKAAADRKIMLVIDCNNYMHFATRGTFKSVQAAKAAALISGMAFKNRDRVGGMVFGAIDMGVQFFTPARQKYHAARLLKLLCDPIVEGNSYYIDQALKQLIIKATPGTLVIVLTDRATILAIDPKILASLCSKTQLIFLPIIDPSDQNLPNLSNLVLKDQLGATLTLNYFNSAMQQQYQQLAFQEAQQVRQLMQKYRLKLINLYTDQPVQRSLRGML